MIEDAQNDACKLYRRLLDKAKSNKVKIYTEGKNELIKIIVVFGLSIFWLFYTKIVIIVTCI